MAQVDELKTVSGGDGPVTDGHGAGSSKVEFTEEQQTKVQQLIDEAYKRAFVKASKHSSVPEEIERLHHEVERLRGDKKAAAVLRAISRYNVVDTEEVAELMKGRVRMGEDGNLTVVGDTGSQRINSSGHPMGFEEYLEQWLGERPHHLRTGAGSGGGSQGAKFGGESRRSYNLADPSTWRNMPREDLEKLLKEGVNVHGAGGQVFKFKDVKNPFHEARKRKFNSGG